MKLIGVDGCRGGWVACSHDGQTYRFQRFEEISRFSQLFPDAVLALIDVPIGLRDDGERERGCDLDARAILGPGRGSSVFVVPSRAALQAEDYETASRVNRERTGRLLSRQSFAILPKIRELDRFFRRHPELHRILMESHPEVGYWALGPARPMKENKRTVEGRAERRAVLAAVDAEIVVALDVAMGLLKDEEAAVDDLLDAACLCLVARQCYLRGMRLLPAEREFDGEGHPMRLVYASSPVHDAASPMPWVRGTVDGRSRRLLLPGLEEAEELLADAKRRCPGVWVDHSRVTADCARRIAERLPGMDPEAAFVLGLLHDIGRRFGHAGMRHVTAGHAFLRGLGWADAARICLTHSFPVQDADGAAQAWEGTSEELSALRALLSEIRYDDYDRLIQLCDALSLPGGPVLLEKRMVETALRHGCRENACERWEALFTIFRSFEDRAGMNLYSLLPDVERNTFQFRMR